MAGSYLKTIFDGFRDLFGKGQLEMNAENFAEVLKDSSLLFQISYQEIKSLVLQYPYCQNLHLLLLEKSRQEKHKDQQKILEKTATHSQDRKHLFYHLRKHLQETVEVDNFLLNEEFLELKNIHELADKAILPPLEELPITSFSPGLSFQDSSSAPVAEPDRSGSSDHSQEDEIWSQLETLFQRKTESPVEETSQTPVMEPEAIRVEEHPAEAEKTTPADFPITEEVIKTVVSLQPVLESFWQKINSKKTWQTPAPPKENNQEDLIKKKKKSPFPQPAPKSSFTSWIQQFQPSHVKLQLGEIMEVQKREEQKRKEKENKKNKKNKEELVENIAQRSIAENKGLISETLADLLAAQEQFDKAIDMYNRLILIFPEKSSYFAGKIEKLKKN